MICFSQSFTPQPFPLGTAQQMGVLQEVWSLSLPQSVVSALPGEPHQLPILTNAEGKTGPYAGF